MTDYYSLELEGIQYKLEKIHFTIIIFTNSLKFQGSLISYGVTDTIYNHDETTMSHCSHITIDSIKDSTSHFFQLVGLEGQSCPPILGVQLFVSNPLCLCINGTGGRTLYRRSRKSCRVRSRFFGKSKTKSS